MADFRKIDPTFIYDKKYNSLNAYGKIAFVSLLCHPNITYLGAVPGFLELVIRTSNLNWANSKKEIARIIALGMMKYDDQNGLIWFPNFLKYNKPQNPNNMINWHKELHKLPEGLLKNEIIQHLINFCYQELPSFTKKLGVEFIDKLKEQLWDPSSVELNEPFVQLIEKSWMNKKKKKEKKKEINNNKKNIQKKIDIFPPLLSGENTTSSNKDYRTSGNIRHENPCDPNPDNHDLSKSTTSSTDDDDLDECIIRQLSSVEEASKKQLVKNSIREIFEHWQMVMGHAKAKLDDKRKGLIAKALKAGYSKEDIFDAIVGCSYTPFNMGKNDQGRLFNGLGVILRDAQHIEDFMMSAKNPPKGAVGGSVNAGTAINALFGKTTLNPLFTKGEEE